MKKIMISTTLMIIASLLMSCGEDPELVVSPDTPVVVVPPVEEETPELTDNPLAYVSNYVYDTTNIVLATPDMDLQLLIDSLYDNYQEGTVMLDTGVYVLAEPLILKSKITIIGRPDATCDQTIVTIDDLTFNQALITNNEIPVSGVNLYNFTVDGAFADEDQHLGSEYHSDGLAETDPLVYNNRIGILIIADGDTYSNAENRDVDLIGMEVRGCSMGVHVKGTLRLLVRDCYLHNNGMIEAYYHNIYLRRCFSSQIDSSRMLYSPTGNGINVSQSEDITVSDNVCSNNFFRGLRLEGESGYVVNYIKVQRNICRYNGDYGCRFNNVDAGLIEDNVSTNNGDNIKKGNLGEDVVFKNNSWD